MSKKSLSISDEVIDAYKQHCYRLGAESVFNSPELKRLLESARALNVVLVETDSSIYAPHVKAFRDSLNELVRLQHTISLIEVTRLPDLSKLPQGRV